MAFEMAKGRIWKIKYISDNNDIDDYIMWRATKDREYQIQKKLMEKTKPK